MTRRGSSGFAAARAAVYATAFVLAFGWIALRVRALDGHLPFGLPPASRIVGAVLTVAGGSLALACVVLFVLRGRGTPALFDPPREFVATGPYRWVRNPMYVGGLGLLAGFGLWHRSPSILLLALAVWVMLHLLVVFVEEPGLERRFGAGYGEYRRAVSRWLPLPPGKGT